jgi:choline dehydrogenase
MAPGIATAYDYVVVGAGSAGCVMAYRLAQAGHRVLVLEAGPDDRGVEAIVVPAAYPQLFRSAYDWDFTTEPQEHARGRRMAWPRGRVVGGSSSLNAQLYVRGHRLDYDGWRDDHGCTGWGYADLLPYFLRAEDNGRGASALHGVDGPLRVEDPRHTDPLSTAFLAAAVAGGLRATDDLNDGEPEGAGLFQVTQRSGRRWSAADAYLRPALATGRVRLVTGALVTSLVLDRGRALGVRWVDGATGVEQEVRAAAEVVVACGTVGSPQLLLLSGIGPADHLRSHGVVVAADVPGVGGNLHDHVAVPVIWLTHGDDVRHGRTTADAERRWRDHGDGPLASTLAEAGAYVRSAAGLTAADLELHAATAVLSDDGEYVPPAPGFTLAPVLVSVASRGRLRLRSADPAAAPAIDPAYLSAPEDVAALVAGVGWARDIAGHEPLRSMLAREWLPGVRAEGSAAVESAVRRFARTLYHPVGTCAMGSGTESVVDPWCRVRGVEGLRVVDASVMPVAPRGNTNAPTIALAERAADLVLGRQPLAPLTSPAGSPPGTAGAARGRG